MDGTLLKGTTASVQIARYLGCAEELAVLEARFAAGELGTRGFAAAIHGLWRSLTRLAVAEVFGACPWLDGIPEVCADIRERGERSVVITMSPDFFARHLLELGFDEVVASRFPALPFREPLHCLLQQARSCCQPIYSHTQFVLHLHLHAVSFFLLQKSLWCCGRGWRWLQLGYQRGQP